MTEERRKATRFPLPDALKATVDDVPVRLLELSTMNARIEHELRFALQSPRLGLEWQGTKINLPLRIMRSEIVARSGSALIYQTGVQFTAPDAEAEKVIASILAWAANPPGDRPAPAPLPPPGRPPMDDTWTRQVQFLRLDLEDELPYAQFRFREGSWVKEYVSSPEQPEDGFTIRRDQTDFGELQRTFECADPETRRMMRIALESQMVER